MTGTTHKLRSLFLTALMVFSVFAGTVALSGSAAAADSNATIQSAVEYEDGGSNYIEVTLNQSTSGDEAVQVLSGGVTASAQTSFDGSTFTVPISGDVTPNRNLSIEVDPDGDGTYETSATDIEVTSSSVVDDADGNDAVNVYRGETIAIVADTPNESLEISGGSTTITTTLSDGNTVYTYESDGLSTGQNYSVEFAGPNHEYFEVFDLGLSVSTPTQFFDSQNVTVDVTADADGTVTAELLDTSGDTQASETVSLTGGKTTTVDFGTVSAGNYTVVMTDQETGNTVETDTIQVVDRGDENALFSPRVVTDERGDVATVTIDLENTDEASVMLGSNATRYWIKGNVTDANDDGQVVLKFNTYTAGADLTEQNGAAITISDILWTDGDSLSDVEEGGTYNQGVDFLTEGDADTLDPGRYEMNVTTGHVRMANVGDTDVGTLAIRERSTNNLTVNVRPASASSAFDSMSAAAVQDALGSSITSADEIADEDLVVHHVDASGLGGVIEFWGPDDAIPSIGGNPESPMEFEIVHTNPGLNQSPANLTGNLDPTNTAIVTDGENDSYYIALDPAVDDVFDVNGHEYDARFWVKGPLSQETTVSDTWTKVAESTALDTNDEGLVTVDAAANQSITGSTNLAPGTSFSLIVESTDAESPFLINPDATVQPDGTFDATTSEFADKGLGTNFTVEVQRSGTTLTDSEGRIVEPTESNETATADGTATQTATATASATPTDTPTSSPTETATDTDTDAATPTDEDGPGFGVAVALIALVGAALLAARRRN